MIPKFIQYPRCGTCVKAAKWLKDNAIEVDSRDIVIDNPTADEVAQWMKLSAKPISKFFNTSGLRYRALNLKDVVKSAPEQELLRILASEGMLVKRPILVTDSAVLLGFNEEQWSKELLNK